MGQNIVGSDMEQSELSVESTLPKILAFLYFFSFC